MIRNCCAVILCTVLLLHGYTHAQPLPGLHSRQPSEKPLLFVSLPDSFTCDNNELRKLTSGREGEEITALLSEGFRVDGKIIYKGQTQPGTFSVNVRLRNYDNALFNITMRLMADNSTLLKGRIIHPRYGDVLLLSQEKGKTVFRKNHQRYVMPE